MFDASTMPWAGQNREDRQVGPEVDVRCQEADGKVGLQVGLLVDGKGLRARLDPVQPGLVHVERPQLGSTRLAGLFHRNGGAVGIACADGYDAVDRLVLQ